ncbi:MAG: acyloxyacyl hydrolase [Terriglobales bacterium]
MSVISDASETDLGVAVSSTAIVRHARRPDFNRNIYYKNKLELSLQTGWLPKNIPFVFDFLLGAGYNMVSLRYTLVPVIASLRWQTGNVRGPAFLRGNWDLNASVSFTAIPRGPETRYISYMMGIRRNFVQPNWRLAPYFEGRVGVGNIDAKEPEGVLFAQGQDLTFTVILHSGLRYNINSRYGMSAGVAYMHISNLYLSEPRYPNYGINVYGPMVGLDVALGKHRARSVQ